MKVATQEREKTSWQAGIPQTGVLVHIEANGVPLVNYKGSESGPMPARTAIASANPGDTVLLLFDQEDPVRPIIIGVVRDCFEANVPQRLRIAAKEVVLEGTEEIRLHCGDSSLTFRKEGKIMLKGREVLSRASRANRIKGATVQIN